MFKCRNCYGVRTSLIEMKKHTNICETKPRNCGMCEERFPNAILFKKHVASKHPKLICKFCGKLFIVASLLKEHVEKHHDRIPQK